MHQGLDKKFTCVDLIRIARDACNLATLEIRGPETLSIPLHLSRVPAVERIIGNRNSMLRPKASSLGADRAGTGDGSAVFTRTDN